MNEWVFTFGCGQENKGRYIRIRALTAYEARNKMFDLYGDKWSFCYSSEDWESIVQKHEFTAETQLGETIIVENANEYNLW